MTGPLVILLLKGAVIAVTVLLLASLVVLAQGKQRLHGRINIVFFALTVLTLIGFEGLIRFREDLFSYILQDPELNRKLTIHLCFAIPSALLVAAGTDPTKLNDLGDRAAHLILPVIVLSLIQVANWSRYLRGSMLEVLRSEYIKLARLKGLPGIVVIAMHAFKNALIPVLTLAGVNLVVMINAAVIIEVIFAWPGIGRLLYEGITFRDFPIVQGVVIIGGAMIVLVNLFVDILYALIDPRIRLES